MSLTLALSYLRQLKQEETLIEKLIGLIISIGLVCFSLSVLLTPLVIKLCAKLSLYDRIDERKIHRGDIPRLGGVAILLSSLLGILIIVSLIPQDYVPVESSQIWVLIIGSLMFFLLGLGDDILALPASAKFTLQLLFASFAALFGIRVEWLWGTIHLPVWLSYTLTLLWLTGMVNAINFIDGLDGLAGGVSAIALFAIVIISLTRADYFFALIALALVGSILGFLPFNFYPARIFLGDGGAMFLGFLLGSLSILGFFKQTTFIIFLIPLLLLLIPITDTTFAIVRRLVRGRSPSEPDKAHIHHRIMRIFSRRMKRTALQNGIQLDDSTQLLLEGVAHRNTVLIIYTISILLCGLAIWLALRGG